MGKYTRKTERGSYSKEKLKEAIREVQSGRMSGYGASKMYQIPRMTIMDHVKGKRQKSTTLGRNTALSPEIECNLATSLHMMEKYGFGLSRKEVLEMVGDYVQQNRLTTSFKNGIPGKDWFLSFKERHGLSVKKPQAVEYARKKAVDPFIIYPYFDLLEKTISDLNLKNKPSAIWNLDETSFSKDPAKTKVVGAKGHASTRVISSPGRENTTVLLGASASGKKAPPLIVFKGKNVWDTWTSPEAYPGTSYAASKNGWMESQIFEPYFKKSFIPLIKDQRPVLLIYDGHSTHLGLNIIEEARKENVTILKLPPHTSHILQPLDIAVMKSFKDRWDPLLVQWQRLNVGKVLPKYELARLIGQVWSEVDPQVLRNGFRKAGIHPVNREEIKEEKFDLLKLRHWTEIDSRRHISSEVKITERNPKTLLTIVLDLLNKTLKHDFLASADKFNNCRQSSKLALQNQEVSFDSERERFVISEEPKNCNVCLVDSIQDQKTSFEELLLQKLRPGDNLPKPQRHKVALGAEVITHDDVLERKKKEQDKKLKPKVNIKNEKKKKQEKGLIKPTNKKQAKEQDNVVYLKDVAKNDIALQRFVAKDYTYLPNCLQRQDSDPKKIKILSNVVIKEADTGKDKKKEGQKDNKKEKNKIYENPKPGPSGLCKTRLKRRRSYSSTSVSGSISSHSDSDIVNIESDISLIDDFECNISAQILDKENIDRNVLTPNIHNEEEEQQVPSYCVGDNVLLRYNTRHRWSYHVGIIENIKLMDEKFSYSIKFYKTIKKPKLTFKMTKTSEHDEVLEVKILKKIDLTRDPHKSNNFFMSSDENFSYFQ